MWSTIFKWKTATEEEKREAKMKAIVNTITYVVLTVIVFFQFSQDY